jgi:hypothetical protein
MIIKCAVCLFVNCSALAVRGRARARACAEHEQFAHTLLCKLLARKIKYLPNNIFA